MKTKQTSIFDENATHEKVIEHIQKNYIDEFRGRILRQAAEIIVEDLRGWAK